MKTELTEEQVVRLMAEREGLFSDKLNLVMCWSTTMRKFEIRDRIGVPVRWVPPYLTSRDSLAPILAGLSGDEWDTLVSSLLLRNPEIAARGSALYFAFKMPARDLAFAIAAVLNK